MEPKTGKIIIDGVEFCPGYTFEEEVKRTLLHRQILAEYGLSDANTFPWEALKDIYDPRSNSSTIVFVSIKSLYRA